MDHNTLSYILYLASEGYYRVKFSLICKFWDTAYIRATKFYNIEIKFRKKISDGKFIELINSYRFSNIINLDISYCDNIEKIPMMNSLRYLWLSHCDKITEIPSFTNIKKLCISGCNNIKIIPESTKDTLVELYMTRCSDITSLLSFTRLEILDIIYCKIVEIPKSTYNTLKSLYMINNDITISNFTALEILCMSYCRNITEIPIGVMNTLKMLTIEYCSLIYLPNFTRLESLHINFSSITELPINIYKTIKSLIISNCHKLVLLDNFLVLEKFITGECDNIKKIPSSTIDTLEVLHIKNNYEISLVEFTELKDLVLINCNIIELPLSICNTLESIYTRGCIGMQIPDEIYQKFYKH